MEKRPPAWKEPFWGLAVSCARCGSRAHTLCVDPCPCDSKGPGHTKVLHEGTHRERRSMTSLLACLLWSAFLLAGFVMLGYFGIFMGFQLQGLTGHFTSGSAILLQYASSVFVVLLAAASGLEILNEWWARKAAKLLATAKGE